MRIHIFTLNWNGEEYLRWLGPSLFGAALKTPCEMEWYIRDNSDNNRSKDVVDSWGMTTPLKHINFYKVGHNRDNYAICNNYLFEKALPNMNLEEDLVLFLNNDIIINDHTSIAKMLKLMTPQVGVVGAKLVYPTGEVQHGGITFRREHGGLPFHYGVGANPTASIISKNREFQAVTFAFALVRAKCIPALRNKQLDPAYNWAFDDVTTNLDIVYRQHLKVVYCGETGITHQESVSLKKNPINKPFQNQNFDRFRREWKDIVDYDHHLYDATYKAIK